MSTAWNGIALVFHFLSHIKQMKESLLCNSSKSNMFSFNFLGLLNINQESGLLYNHLLQTIVAKFLLWFFMCLFVFQFWFFALVVPWYYLKKNYAAPFFWLLLLCEPIMYQFFCIIFLVKFAAFWYKIFTVFWFSTDMLLHFSLIISELFQMI